MKRSHVKPPLQRTHRGMQNGNQNMAVHIDHPGPIYFNAPATDRDKSRPPNTAPATKSDNSTLLCSTLLVQSLYIGNVLTKIPLTIYYRFNCISYIIVTPWHSSEQMPDFTWRAELRATKRASSASKVCGICLRGWPYIPRFHNGQLMNLPVKGAQWNATWIYMNQLHNLCSSDVISQFKQSQLCLVLVQLGQLALTTSWLPHRVPGHSHHWYT